MCTEYMQDINLFLGFNEVVHMACKEKGNQITRKETRTLLTAYTKACNKHQLVVINRHHKPLAVVGGSIWSATAGSVNRFMDIVAKKLGRELDLREINFIKPQYQQLITRQRTEGAIVTNTKIGEGDLKTYSSGDPNAWNRLMSTGGDKLKAAILASVTTNKTKASNMDWRKTFDFTIERKALKARLKLPVSHKRYINHQQYNQMLKVLQTKREDVVAYMKHVQKDLRNMHKNSGSIHVTNNVKGSMDTGTGGKRFSKDGFEHGMGGTMSKAHQEATLERNTEGEVTCVSYNG